MSTYIARAGVTGPVKIGRADDPHGRIRDLQTAHHEELTIIRVIDTPFDSEGEFHRQFAAHRIRGEWFSFVDEMMTFVPSEPEQEATVRDVVSAARRAARKEAANLIDDIWQFFRGLESRLRFERRIAGYLQCKQARARNLMYGRARRIEVHEIAGLRAVLAKLKRATDLPRSVRPDDLVTRMRDSEGR